MIPQSAISNPGRPMPGTPMIDWRGVRFVLGLGLVTFIVSVFCMQIPRGSDGNVLIWYTNGIAFAALIRAPLRRWPVLIAASALGIAAAGLVCGDTPLRLLMRPLASVVQFTATAYVVRRKLGPTLNLTTFRGIAWLFAITAGISALTIMVLAWLTTLSPGGIELTVGSLLRWHMTSSLSMLVLGVPLLALTSRVGLRHIRMDLQGVAVLLLLLAVEIAILFLSFGPTALPGAFAVMPVLMLIAWLYGLQGGGLANVMATIVVSYFVYRHLGTETILARAGYASYAGGLYLSVFFCACQLTTFPLAIARARQNALTEDLAAALAGAEARAIRLQQSEQAAKRAEAEAVQARERLRNIIETSTDIICTLDAEGRFIEISENCRDLWGLPREALIGRPFLDLIVPEERSRMLQLYDPIANGPFKQAVRTNHLLPDGTVMPMSWSATWAEDEQVRHCVGRDMSEYNAMEARFHHAQRMDAIGQLTGGVAHDFNNLLTVVLGSCEAVALELEDPEQRQLMEMALQAGERCAELTRQLLAFARRQTLAPQAFDLNDRIAAAAPLIMRTLGSDLEFSIRTSKNLRKAFADPLQTETAILNLCLNARDAMPHGGKLLIETSNATLGPSYVKRNPDAQAGEYVMITVSDTGTGIAADVLPRIFDPFFTTKEVGKGSGLGLSMVHGFVNQSNGHVRVVSKLGKGTKFHLYLPAADRCRQPAVKPLPQAKPLRHGHEHILLVEDHPLVREHLENKLRSLGYHVTLAGGGADALAVLEARDDVDLLLTDVVMPGGMDGVELGRIVAARWPGIRVLYTSGYAPDTLASSGWLLDGATLLTKPYTKSELAAKVRATLDGAMSPVA